MRRPFLAAFLLALFASVLFSADAAPYFYSTIYRTGAVVLHWEVGREPAAGEAFYILRRDEAGDWPVWGVARAKTWVDRRVQPGQELAYRVELRDASGRTLANTPVLVAHVENVMPVVPPVAFHAVDRGGEVELIWRLEEDARAGTLRFYRLAPGRHAARDGDLVAEAEPEMRYAPSGYHPGDRPLGWWRSLDPDPQDPTYHGVHGGRYRMRRHDEDSHAATRFAVFTGEGVADSNPYAWKDYTAAATFRISHPNNQVAVLARVQSGHGHRNGYVAFVHGNSLGIATRLHTSGRVYSPDAVIALSEDGPELEDRTLYRLELTVEGNQLAARLMLMDGRVLHEVEHEDAEATYTQGTVGMASYISYWRRETRFDKIEAYGPGLPQGGALSEGFDMEAHRHDLLGHGRLSLPGEAPGERWAMTVAAPEGGETAPLVANVSGRVPDSPFRGQPREHPFLFINREEIEAIRRRIQTDDDYRLAFEQGLLLDAEQAWQNIRTGERDLPRQRAGVHQSTYWRGMQWAALGFAFTGEERFAEAVRDTLLEYCEFYKDIPIVRPWADGHLTGQTLNESMMLLHGLWAYDLVFHTLSEEDRETIRRELFRPAADLLLRHDRGASNWQSWHNAAMAALGLMLDDEFLYERAVRGPSGFMHQLEHSMHPDGVWHEQSIAYHYFSMHAMTLLAEIGYRQGEDLFAAEVAGQSLRGLYDSPFRHAFSNLNQAPFGNSQTHYRLRASWIAWNFALAFARYGEPRYRWLWDVNDMLRARLRGESRMHVLLCLPMVAEGPAPERFAVGTAREAGWRDAMGSTLLEGVGMAVLRGAPGRQTPEASLTYQPHGNIAGHQHPNNLGIFWQSYAHRWISSSGKWAGYGTDVHLNWVKQTLSDNTLVVDRSSQRPVYPGSPSWVRDDPENPSSGRIEAFTAGPVFGFAQAFTDRVYEGVALRRRLWLTDKYALDVFHAKGEKEHVFDYPLHITGELAESNVPLSPREEPLADHSGYAYLGELHEGAADGDWRTVWQPAHGPEGLQERLTATVLGVPGSQVYTARTPWSGDRERSLKMVSRKGQSGLFVAVWQAHGEEEAPVEVAWVSREPLADAPERGAVRIRHGDGEDVIQWHELGATATRTDASGGLLGAKVVHGRVLYYAGQGTWLVEYEPLDNAPIPFSPNRPGVQASAPVTFSLARHAERAWVLALDDAYPAEFAVNFGDWALEWRAFRLSQEGRAETPVEMSTQQRGVWSLPAEPYGTYLLVPADMAPEAIPPVPLVKVFGEG